jgi:transposase
VTPLERMSCESKYKRLERGEFQFPRSNATAVEITSEQLLRLLSGLSVAERKSA